MHSQVVFYFVASAIILTHSKIASVNGQCTTEGCTHDDLSMNIVTEIQQQIVQTSDQQNKQIQNIHDLLSSQHDAVMRSFQAVNRRLEEHDAYIKKGICDVVPPVRDCFDIKARGYTANGVYEVCAGNQSNRVCANAYCDMRNDTSLVFQRRKDGSVNFNRTWAEYRDGFGNPDGEFWLGNEMLYLLTSKRNYKLRIDLEDFNGTKRYAEYSTFSINSSADKYRLKVGNYSGNAGDSMDYNNGCQFTTIDADNDLSASNCALFYGGAWWHRHCSYANLNTVYHQRYDTVLSERGILWQHFQNSWSESLKATEMKLVPMA